MTSYFTNNEEPSMYSPRQVVTREPAAISAAIVAVVNALVLFDIVAISEAQLSGVNIALVAVLGLFTRQSVTANGNL